jgi:hypothetical protein
MKPFKTTSKPMLKNIVISSYGEIDLKILKEKPIKSIRIKAHLSVSTMYPWGTNFLRNKKKKIISKRLLKTRSNFNPLEVHNHHLVKV